MSRIQIQNLTFSYDGSCDTIFENVSFQIDTDWKLGFTGRNGRGKTTFLNLLLGKYEYSGKITSPVEFGYFPFDLNGTLESTLDEIRALGIGCDEWEVEREIGKLGLRSDVLARPLRTLSKGEQTKIKLAALFLKEIGFLLIDEPTNHLDENGARCWPLTLQGRRALSLYPMTERCWMRRRIIRFPSTKQILKYSAEIFPPGTGTERFGISLKRRKTRGCKKKSDGLRRPRRRRSIGRIRSKHPKSAEACAARKPKASADALTSVKNRGACSRDGKIWNAAGKELSKKRARFSMIWKKMRSFESGRFHTVRSCLPSSGGFPFSSGKM